MDESSEMVEPGCTFAHRHPLLLCSLLFLAFLYAFFYPIFAFLLASSPVLILATFLLGIVLLHSLPQETIDQHHVYKKIQSRPPLQCHHITTTVGRGTHHHHQQRPSRGSPSTSSSSNSDDNDLPAAVSAATSLTSFPDATSNDSSSDSEHERPHEQKHHHDRQPSQEVVHAVAWTADDAKSIENIGSLELERNAAVEKLMFQRLASPMPQQHGRHVHHHIATTRNRSNPFDLDDDGDFPGSAPSTLLHPASHNPFFDDDGDLLPLHAPHPQPQQQQSLPSSLPPGTEAAVQKKNAVLFRRHESFTVGAPHASDFRPSRFRPYFVIDKMQSQPVTVPDASGKSSPSSSSSSSSSSFSAGANAYDSVSANNKEEEEAAERQEALEEAKAAAMLEAKTDDRHELARPREVVALDVELISDSSDDDISLPEPMKVQQQQPPPPQQQQVVVSDQDDDDEGESFEVESITKQVAAAAEGKGKQADPAYDYSPSAGTVETKQQEQALDQLPPLAPPSMAQIKLASMRRVFSEEEADEPWAAPSRLEETTTTEKEVREQDMFPLPPLPESAPSASAAPPLAAAVKKAAGKSSKYKPPSKKAVLGFFQGKGKA